MIKRILVSAVSLVAGFAVVSTSAEPNPAPAPVDLLAAGHEQFIADDFPGARASYEKLLASEAPAALRSIARISIAQSFEREGNLARAKAEYTKLAQMPDAPPHHRWEAEQRLRELTRKDAGLPARDPLASRTQLPASPEPARRFYVAPDGSDSGSGSAEQPFATLERARDGIRALNKQGPLPSGGVAVIVRGGEYNVTRTFTLEAQDSGSEAAPIVYRAAPGETPRFRGGIRLTAFRPVSDPAVLERLPEESRGKVLESDLKAAGVKELMPLKLGGFSSGHGFRTHPAHELFFNGKALQLARGPNEGFLRIKDVAVRDGTKGYDREGSKVGQFFYEGDRPARWAAEPDLLLYGYWFWDWADSYERVESIDTERRLITLAQPLHKYGFSIGAPFYAINALSELDTPGEWYLDRTANKLYFHPPSDAAQATIEFSLFRDPMMRMENVSHVRFENLLWELGSADAIQIRGGTNVLIAGCTIRHFAGNAIEVHGGTGHGILSTDIHSMGRGGVVLNGGNRRNLTPSGHFVENCHIHNLSRIDRTYTPALLLNGVGHRAAHNRLENIPSSGMRVNGNDHLVEFNEIFNVVRESDDQGGADMFGNPTFLGNVFRYNYWHHIGHEHSKNDQPKCGKAGIRLDDAISGTLVYGNIFYRASAGKIGFGGVQIHGGKDNMIDNNLFVECAAMVSFTPWNEQRWKEFVNKSVEDKGIDKALYLERYPEMGRLLENANSNSIWRNVGVACGQMIRRDPKRGEWIGNYLAPASVTTSDLKKTADQRPGFAVIPFDEIGLYKDQFRRELSDNPMGASLSF
jgi:hypothetical protein